MSSETATISAAVPADVKTEAAAVAAAHGMSGAVSFETGASGTLVMIEPERIAGLDRRVFKQVGAAYEWCHFAEWRDFGERARWYGWAGKELPDSMRAT